MDWSGFNRIEKKYHLLEEEIEGYHFWVYLRVSLKGQYVLSMGGLQQDLTGTEKHGRLDLRKRWRKIKDICTGGQIPKVRCDILFLNHPRRVFVDGVYDCIYTDDIAAEFSNSAVLEEAYNNIHYKPIRTRNIVYTDRVEFYNFLFCTLQRLLCPRKYEKVKKIMLDKIRKPMEELNSLYGVDLRPEKFENEMLYGYYIHKVEYWYYKKIIQKLKPRVILEVVSYNRKCMTVNEIAKKMKIPTIELQHGVLGTEHIAYNFPVGYHIQQFPQYIFTFSDYWNKNTRFPIEPNHVRAVGYPYLEKMAQKYAVGKGRKGEKKVILFLSSGPIGIELADVAVQLRDLLDKEMYRIIFKLHPNDCTGWKERYPALHQADGIEVIDNNQVNLYQLFSISDIQVSGFNSTTIFEGLFFSLQTYILRYNVLKEIADLCDSGVAAYFDNAESLAEQIKRDKNQQKNVGAVLWKKNSLQNTIREIKEIMNQGAEDE